jgi:hypothetical protein
MMATFVPADFKIAAVEDATIPFPKLEQTPPVTKMNFELTITGFNSMKILGKCKGNKEIFNCQFSIFNFVLLSPDLS